MSKLFFLLLVGLVSNLHATERLCGLQGSVQARIKDCNLQRGGFVLVARYAPGKEVYQDLKTGLVWSETLSQKYSYYYDQVEELCKKNQEEFAGLSQLKWKVPTVFNYIDSIENGMQKDLPHLKKDAYWSSTPHKFYVNSRYIFEADEKYTPRRDGSYVFRHLETEFSALVKCVGVE